MEKGLGTPEHIAYLQMIALSEDACQMESMGIKSGEELFSPNQPIPKWLEETPSEYQEGFRFGWEQALGCWSIDQMVE